MEVRVRYFAMQRQQLGRRDERLELGDGATIGDAWARLVETHDVLAPAGETIRFARNGRYAGAHEPLADGDELALIPPVAGGVDPGADSVDASARRQLELTAAPIDEQRVARLLLSVPTDADGAVTLFVGRTRVTPGTPAPGQEEAAARHAGRSVEALEYEAFEPMALAELGRIADEIEERFGVTGLAIVHRTGEVAVGEVSVAIAAAAAHRGAAFDACRYAIEELKARAPIWKSERFADGSVWLGAPARDGPHDGEGRG
jgi:molybdopterin synthase catalytic subunit